MGMVNMYDKETTTPVADPEGVRGVGTLPPFFLETLSFSCVKLKKNGK